MMVRWRSITLLVAGLMCAVGTSWAAKAPAMGPLVQARALATRADSVLASGRLFDRAALDPAELAWRLRETALPPGHPDRLASLDQLARLHAERDSLALAARFAEQQRAEVLLTSPPDTVRWARALARLAMVASREGRGSASTAQLDSALALLGGVATRDTSLWAMLLNTRGSEAISLDHYARAEADLALALQLRNATQGERSADIATLLNNQGNLAGRPGDVREALRLHRLALDMRRATLGRDHPDVALSLGTIATDENTLGRYVEARDHATEALVLIERALGPDHSRMVRPLNTLINSLSLLRDLPGALEQSQRLKRITLAATAPGSVARALPHRQLALAYARLQRHAEAQAQLDTARAIVERTVGPQSLEMAGVMWRQVNISEARKDTAGIVKAMREARTIYQRLGVDDASETHGVTLRLALFDQQRDTSEVFRDFRTGIAGMTRVLTEMNPEVAVAHRDYAIALMRQGRVAEAFAEAAICDRIQRTHFLGLVRSLGESEALQYSRQRLNGVHLMTWAASRGEDPAHHRLAYDATVRSRLLLFDELAARRQLSRSPGTRAAELERQVGQMNSALSRLVQRGVAGESRERYDQQLSALRSSRDSLHALLLASTPSAGRVYAGAQAGLDSVLLARAKDVALVSYATVRVPTATGDLRFYGAFVVPPRSRQPVFVRLANADTLERSIRAWLAELGQPGDTARTDWRPRAARLHATLWAPFAPRLRGAREVVVVPDGMLAQLPFHLLADPYGRLLLDSGPLLRLRGSERDLIGDAFPGASGQGLLAMGAPDFDSRSSEAAAAGVEQGDGLREACVRAGEYRFTPLPGAAAELSDVAEVWRARPRSGERVQTLSGAEATEPEFRTRAPGQRVLHLATHGFFLDDRCGAAAGARGIGGLAPSSDATGVRATGSPLLRCGLALAGANRSAEASGDPRDGWLTAEEVAGMDLWSVDCAVLSACETAGGSIEITEGLVGLERAFRIAGVKSLVTSCWAVDDQATREWMTEFHRAFDREHGDTARAVRATTIAVRAVRHARGDSDAPFYWAPFIATGR